MDFRNFWNYQISKLRIRAKSRFARVFCCLLIFSTIPACGFVEFGYKQIPLLVTNRIESEFDLNDDQRDAIHFELNKFLVWHRNTELKQYEITLREAARLAEDGVDQQEILWFIEETRDARNRSMTRLIQQMSTVGVSLDTKQIQHFRQQQIKRQEKYKDDPESNFEIAEERLEQIEKLTGSITGDYRKNALKQLSTIPDYRSDALRQYRLARNESIISALQNSQQADELRDSLLLALINKDSKHAQDYEPTRQQFWQNYAETLAGILSSLPQYNQQQIVKNISQYADIVADLSE